MEEQGFAEIQIRREIFIELPDKVLSVFLNEKELEDFKKSETGIFSITVSCYKPF